MDPGPLLLPVSWHKEVMSLGCYLEKVQEADREEERAWESQFVGAAVTVSIDGHRPRGRESRSRHPSFTV